MALLHLASLHLHSAPGVIAPSGLLSNSKKPQAALNSCDITKLNLTQRYSKDIPASSLPLKKSHLYSHSPRTVENWISSSSHRSIQGETLHDLGFVVAVEKNTSRFSEGTHSTLVLGRSEISAVLTWGYYSIM